MLQQWQTGIIVRSEVAAPDIIRYWVQVPVMDSFDFKPGQFVTLDLPIHEQRNKRWRSYSIASPPDGTNVFELCIVLVPDGLGTPYIWEHFKPGHQVTMRGPVGVFTLPDLLERDIAFICTGTGIAPFRSMSQAIRMQNKPSRNVYLIFGTRTKADLLYHNELIQLEKDMPNFKYIYALSREEDPTYHGVKGYVHKVYEDLFSDHRPAYFYLCGWRNMIDDARHRLAAMGYGKDSVHVELYG
jgi:CDP-4-dehydro-6-deoxyglucose reductase